MIVSTESNHIDDIIDLKAELINTKMSILFLEWLKQNLGRLTNNELL